MERIGSFLLDSVAAACYGGGGELALLYMSVWIFLAGNGAGPWSLDRMRRRAASL